MYLKDTPNTLEGVEFAKYALSMCGGWEFAKLKILQIY